MGRITALVLPECFVCYPDILCQVSGRSECCNGRPLGAPLVVTCPPWAGPSHSRGCQPPPLPLQASPWKLLLAPSDYILNSPQVKPQRPCEFQISVRHQNNHLIYTNSSYSNVVLVARRKLEVPGSRPSSFLSASYAIQASYAKFQGDPSAATAWARTLVRGVT